MRSSRILIALFAVAAQANLRNIFCTSLTS
jgi:hypothetical protein